MPVPCLEVRGHVFKQDQERRKQGDTLRDTETFPRCNARRNVHVYYSSKAYLIGPSKKIIYFQIRRNY